MASSRTWDKTVEDSPSKKSGNPTGNYRAKGNDDYDVNLYALDSGAFPSPGGRYSVNLNGGEDTGFRSQGRTIYFYGTPPRIRIRLRGEQRKNDRGGVFHYGYMWITNLSSSVPIEYFKTDDPNLWDLGRIEPGQTIHKEPWIYNSSSWFGGPTLCTYKFQDYPEKTCWVTDDNNVKELQIPTSFPISADNTTYNLVNPNAVSVQAHIEGPGSGIITLSPNSNRWHSYSYSGTVTVYYTTTSPGYTEESVARTFNVTYIEPGGGGDTY